jgi:uncharacterized membrane protein YjjB (DUF3815 family)
VVGAEIIVLPTTLFVKFDAQNQTQLDVTTTINRSLRLDQVRDLYTLVDEAERGTVPLATGLQRLESIWASPPRFGPVVTVAGHAILTIGLGLQLFPTLGGVVVCIILGILVGLLKLIGQGQSTLRVLLPIAAALIVSALVFLAVKQGLGYGLLTLVIPPLITFLPGGALTMAMIELADGEMIAGASRLVSGAVQIMLLAFGLVAGTTLVGLPPAEAFVASDVNLLGWWAPWVGVFLFGLGIFLHFAAPRGSLHWLLLVLYIAWLGERLGSQLVGPYLGAFIGALAITPVAIFAAQRGGPPTLVTFLPAFWLLVPGALGLIGVAELVGQNHADGVEDFTTTVFTIIAIALGILVGTALTRPFRRMDQE